MIERKNSWSFLLLNGFNLIIIDQDKSYSNLFN